jgi:LmbE family N-acetylglucosaminyl deacetylase
LTESLIRSRLACSIIFWGLTLKDCRYNANYILYQNFIKNGMPVALFIFAHQDDESGCFYEIHRLVNRGDTVWVVYLTSGTFDGSLSSIRNAESIAVLGEIGVPEENIFFLGTRETIPDGRLCKNLEVALQSLINLTKEMGVPSKLYFHAWEGGHQDHDAVHLVGVALAENLGLLDQCYQFPFYTGVNLPAVFFRMFICLPENGEPVLARIPWKQRIKFITFCFSYRSQIKTWLGLFPYFLIHHMFNGTQALQRILADRIHRPPHAGVLLYERRGVYSYEEFAKDRGRFKVYLPEAIKARK